MVKIEHKNLFEHIFNIEFNWKTISLLAFLAIFPNIIGLATTNVFGVKIHFFQYLIFLAAVIYGPSGGATAGAFGSVWTAVALNNPYILVGNVILGFMVGFLFKKNVPLVLAAMLAYLIQLPWLWVTDIYLAGMPVPVVKGIVIGLLVSDLILAIITRFTWKNIRKAIA